MASATTNTAPNAGTSPSGSGQGGIFAAALRYLGSISRHLAALAGLAQIEVKEAATIYLKVAVFIIIGLIAGVFGYIFFILFLAFLIGSLFGVSWVWIALGLALLHLAVAAICAWNVREGLTTPTFSATAAEVRKDIENLSRCGLGQEQAFSQHGQQHQQAAASSRGGAI